MEVSRIKIVALGMVVLLFCAGIVGCAKGELEGTQERQNADETQNDSHDDNQTANQSNNESQNDSPAAGQPSEVHQLCAAAGTSSDGKAQSLYCFGPHDASGFEASDGTHTWQPGGLRVVAQ